MIAKAFVGVLIVIFFIKMLNSIDLSEIFTDEEDENN